MRKSTDNKKNIGRIELHCHSKSGGNATMYAGELIRYASMQGMPAIAITDRSSIRAFPEIESTCELKEYTTKPIYGMEMLVRETPDGDIYTISILVRNETGKENLYRMISEAEGNTVFDYKKLMENREGLLLGSGAENAKLRLRAKDGATDEELKEIIRTLDYVEVLPYDWDKHINKKLIKLCDEEDVPVVAVSDAHYLREEDRDAWKAVNLTVSPVRNMYGVHLYSTEEMVTAFSYLSAESAKKIIIDNPYKIAEMCEEISISPKEKIYPYIPDADERIRDICKKKLEEKYDEEEREKAKAYLETELTALRNTGMAFHLLQTKELMDKCALRSCDVSLRGTGAGSMVCFLMGISELDPIRYHLSPEMIYGQHNDRCIDVDINIPHSMLSMAHKKMRELEGVGKALEVGCEVSVSDYRAYEILDNFETEESCWMDDEEHERLSGKIIGNYTGIERHPGGVLLFPEGYDHTKIMPTWKLPDGEVSYFEFYHFPGILKADVLGHMQLDALKKLSEKTGVDLQTVPERYDGAMKLFKPDKNGDINGCIDLPGFKTEQIREMIAVLNPKSFDDLVKVSALAHGTGAWIENGEELVRNKGIALKDLIATRDDIMDQLMMWGMERTEAYEIAEVVRKGIAKHRRELWKKKKEAMEKAHVPNWFIGSCDKISYLFPRAHAISYMFMTMRLAWFKINYPKEYVAVAQEFDF